MAESAAKQIYLLREYRLDLLTGNSDEIPQERSFEILLNEMNKREALLTSLFMGTVETVPICVPFTDMYIGSPERLSGATIPLRSENRKAISLDVCFSLFTGGR